MAMVGLGISWRRREVSMRERKACAFSSMVVPPNSVPSAIALTSPPAQKPRPAPVSTTTPSLMVSSSSVVIGDSFGRGNGSRSGRCRQRSHVGDQRADLGVGQMIAEGGHARPADGRAAVLDQVEHVVVRERRYRLPVLEIARPDEKYGGAPRATAVGAVTGRAVREVSALYGGRVLGHGVRQEEKGEHAAAHEEETGRQDDEQPF